MLNEKSVLRTQLKAKRRELSRQEIAQKSDNAVKNLLPLLENHSCVMAYLSAFKEVCVDEAIEQLIRSSVKVCVPVSDESTHTITPVRLTDLGNISHGAYGIREPISEELTNTSEITAAIIPGIGFDLSGRRIGFGMGYYDRFLQNFKGLKIGVCYEFQLVDKIPTEITDIPMDIIVTEMNCYVI